MNYFLGIDAGGTKTEAVLLDAKGRECGRGMGGAGSLAVCNDATLRESLCTAIRDAEFAANLNLNTPSHYTAVCAGVAGYSLRERREAFADILRDIVPADNHAVVPDYEIALYGATNGEPGVVVIAGTGSVTFGRNAKGETHKAGGMGYLLGDEGSGCQLGLKALRHAVGEMQAGTHGALTTALLAYIGAETHEDALTWTYTNFTPAKAAALAPLIGQIADSGDSDAHLLLHDAAMSLQSDVMRVVYALRLPASTPVVPLGGLWRISNYLIQQFAAPVPEQNETNNAFTIQTAAHDAAFGAALMALHNEKEA